MEFYRELASVADDLLGEFGQNVVIKKFQTGERNEQTGVMQSGEPTIVIGKGVLLDYIYRTFGDHTSDNTLIQGADKRLLLNAANEIDVKDRLVVNGIEYSIVNYKQVNPAGTVVLYDVWIRR